MRFTHASALLSAFATVAALVALASADYGDCTYNTKRCSCKYGSAIEGRCWDAVAGKPGQCASRYCAAGWTCVCGGRTHLCYLEKRATIKISGADKKKANAPCPVDPATGKATTEIVAVASGPEIRLGTFTFDVSPKGVQANACNDIAWWYNGDLRTVYKPVPGTVYKTKELNLSEDHYLLELRGGDVLAWRYRASSYYCQIHNIVLTINGTVVSDVFSNPLINITYSRAYSPGWFSPSFIPTYGKNEISDSTLSHFLAPRTRKFNGTTIAPDADVDYWSTPNQTDPDSKTSNWYWRIAIDPSYTTTSAKTVGGGTVP